MIGMRVGLRLRLPKGLSLGHAVLADELALGLRQATYEVQGAAQRLAPYRTGNLRRSITSAVAPAGRGMRGIVGAAAPYARYVEEGTGVYGPLGKPIQPVQARALSWLDRSGVRHFARAVWGMRPRPFMRPAFLERRDAALGHIQGAIRRALARLGGEG